MAIPRRMRTVAAGVFLLALFMAPNAMAGDCDYCYDDALTDCNITVTAPATLLTTQDEACIDSYVDTCTYSCCYASCYDYHYTEGCYNPCVVSNGCDDIIDPFDRDFCYLACEVQCDNTVLPDVANCTSTCEAAEKADRDNDGTNNGSDNCPYIANANQNDYSI